MGITTTSAFDIAMKHIAKHALVERNAGLALGTIRHIVENGSVSFVTRKMVFLDATGQLEYFYCSNIHIIECYRASHFDDHLLRILTSSSHDYLRIAKGLSGI